MLVTCVYLGWLREEERKSHCLKESKNLGNPNAYCEDRSGGQTMGIWGLLDIGEVITLEGPTFPAWLAAANHGQRVSWPNSARNFDLQENKKSIIDLKTLETNF